jgi:predicted amidohydrolase
LIVSPWGEVLGEAGTDPGVIVADIDPALSKQAREKVPNLQHDRIFTGP